MSLEDLLRAPLPGRVDDVAARLLAIEEALPDEALGELDRVVAMWNVRKARAAAWVNAETLWALRDVPFAAGRFAVTLDRVVGFSGRGLLRRVL